MKEFNHVIKDKEGIHARPAGELVKKASGFKSDIRIAKDGKTVDAKRIFGVMSLAAKQGQTVTITVNGEDEDEAVEAIEVFMKENM